MLTDALELTLLFDFYGELLTEKQRVCFDLYYNQDLSLAEIAASEGISRQGVHDSIMRSEAALRGFEQTLGCVARERTLQQTLEAISTAVDPLRASTDENVRHAAEAVSAAIDSLKE